MKRSFTLLFLCLTLSGKLLAQVQLAVPPSPNAASLGIFGKIPVDYFTGIPSIGVPIYTVTSGSISVPISLAYHAGLLKPDQHPGWVGLGWNLNAGGAITRKTNSGVDEFKESDDDPEQQSNPYIHSYYNNAYAIGVDNWYTVDFFNTHNANTNPFDLDADEFDFNFGNYSGCFYLDYNGNWQVRSNTPVQLKITDTLVENFPLQSVATYVMPGKTPVLVPRIFYAFTITTEDGTQYQFGNDPNAIEFSRPLRVATNPTPFSAVGTSFLKDEIQATTWMLTKITSPKGDTVAFHYIRDGINTIESSSTNLYNYTQYNNGTVMNSGSGGGIEQFAYSIVNPVYLTEIDAKHTAVKFKCSNSKQLDYPIVFNNLGSYAGWDIPGHDGHAVPYPTNTWKKLDTIQLFVDQAPLKDYLLTYLDNSSSRAFLLSVQEQGSDGKVNPPYSFFYNQTPLPAYNSFETDHWGFYNGHSFYQLYPTHYADFSYLPQYKTSRDPVAGYLYAGVLDSLTYPTGGSTSFIYEPHTYSAVNGRYPFQVNPTVIDSIAGGLRIHYIKNYSASGQLASTKEYLYQQSGSTRSSGILGGPTVYLESGNNVPLINPAFKGSGVTLTYKYWYSYSVEPLSYNKGSHISYSRVTERDVDPNGTAGNGYTVYNYSNFDNSWYQDKNAIAFVQGIGVSWKQDPYNSAEHVRGNLLSKADYDNQNRMIDQSIMTYDTTENLSPSNVRAWSHSSRQIGSGVIDDRYTAYLEYTNKPFPLSKEEHTYSYNPNTDIKEVTNYYYDNALDNQLTRTVTIKSTGQVITNATVYASDYLGSTAFVNDMLAKHEIGLPIEQVIYQDDSNGTKILHGTVTEYKAGGKGLVDQIYNWDDLPEALAQFKFSDRTIGLLPYSGTVNSYSHDNSYMAKVQVNGYDAAGNIRMLTKAGSVHESCLWGYDKTYPIAEIKNADTTEFYYEGFEQSTAAGVINTAAHTGNKSSTATTVNWTKPNTRSYVITYWYLAGGTWKLFPETAYTSTSFTLTGGAAYDDIRIYPSDAMMTTYTFNPLVGLTSSTDAKGQTSYFEYDSFQRLVNVKDQYGNVIKHMTYHYQGQ
jgi:YD repeat-containing protein